ncbi:hypothetical protein Ciccas_010691 [Cichlidogyrus casuarinus]|uniref:PH domain-containing protein n=1 Tax=Cichlidogyrus casuarinus TaxID=1844966 RepID=A0ABD2PTF1_9PLAT
MNTQSNVESTPVDNKKILLLYSTNRFDLDMWIDGLAILLPQCNHAKTNKYQQDLATMVDLEMRVRLMALDSIHYLSLTCDT